MTGAGWLGTGWQELAVTLLAAVAVAWLLWRRRRAKRGCDDCALAEAARTLPLDAGRATDRRRSTPSAR